MNGWRIVSVGADCRLSRTAALLAHKQMSSGSFRFEFRANLRQSELREVHWRSGGGGGKPLGREEFSLLSRRAGLSERLCKKLLRARVKTSTCYTELARDSSQRDSKANAMTSVSPCHVPFTTRKFSSSVGFSRRCTCFLNVRGLIKFSELQLVGASRRHLYDATDS